MRLFLSFWGIFLILLFSDGSLSAQSANDSLNHKPIHRIGIELHPSYVIPTHRFIKGKNLQGDPIVGALSGHIKYGFHFAETSRYHKLYPTAYQGIGIGYNTFFNTSELGNPIAIYAFQGSRIKRLSPVLTFDYEWNFGISFGWKEYDKETNERNHVIGSNLDAYMNLAFLLNWQLSTNCLLTTGISMTHCSNGNTRYPNQGINLIETKIGIVRTFGNPKNYNVLGTDEKPTSFIKRHVSYDLIVYGGFRIREINYNKKKYVLKKNYGVCGFNFNPMYHLNNNLSVGGSLDFQYDESSNLGNHISEIDDKNITVESQPFHERLSAGLSVRGEWAMPIFSINGGIGYNFYAKSFDTKKFYQILAMKIFLNPQIFLHIGYQMNQFKDPNNLMLGFGYRFNA